MLDFFTQKIQNPNESFFSVEVIPSISGNQSGIYSKIDESGIIEFIDGFVVTDSPFGKIKSSPLFTALGLQQKYKIPALATLSLRDRNKIALQSDILGATEHGVQGYLLLTGDKHESKTIQVKNVFEGSSLMLLDMVQDFNSGKNYFGMEFKETIKPIYPFVVSNSFAKNYDALKKKIKNKVDRGALAIFTQPVYCIECIKKLLEIRDEVRNTYAVDDKRSKFEIVFGFFPLMKKSTMTFIDENIKGIDIPIEFKERFVQLDDTNEQEMLNFNKQLFDSFLQKHQKFHLMGLNNFNLIKSIVESKNPLNHNLNKTKYNQIR